MTENEHSPGNLPSLTKPHSIGNNYRGACAELLGLYAFLARPHLVRGSRGRCVRRRRRPWAGGNNAKARASPKGHLACSARPHPIGSPETWLFRPPFLSEVTPGERALHRAGMWLPFRAPILSAALTGKHICACGGDLASRACPFCVGSKGRKARAPPRGSLASRAPPPLLSTGPAVRGVRHLAEICLFALATLSIGCPGRGATAIGCRVSALRARPYGRAPQAETPPWAQTRLIAPSPILAP